MTTQPVLIKIDRATAIRALRETLLKLRQEGRSTCSTVADLRIFCRGFARYSDQELRARYGWLRGKDDESRITLEARANWWELTRQDFEDAELVCDIETQMRGSCPGWKQFTNGDLNRFLAEIFGEGVFVVSSTSAGTPE